ncbi:elongation factor P maturation arginine rhamnosyltransferase EarP [Schlesneria sp. T3-172]|uniref:elongation factor P maturation arginine rhamnosyltransferase EarP n=1 Tax=Schlesneria sphaerica TaxID=3373610 RepID=UPI0037C6C2E7
MSSWDIFCSVVDNFGDVGVCWRLARQLSQEHRFQVRLWVDDLETFAVMSSELSPLLARQKLGSVEVLNWTPDCIVDSAADVVIEAFGCELSDNYLNAMVQREKTPVWINLEYLSAESWVEECHGLVSPHPRLPMKKYFFYPGFTEKTGGLLRERGLLASHAGVSAADDALFLNQLVVPDRQPHEVRLSLFCYENPILPDLLSAWAHNSVPIRVLASPGAARKLLADWFQTELVDGMPLTRGTLTVHPIPFLLHTDYDRLLRVCDLNFVRGEDSFIRAQWAKRPFVWQIYPQSENTHLVKLEAFLSRYLSLMPDVARQAVRNLWYVWNGAVSPGNEWGDFLANLGVIQSQTEQWSSQLDRMPDLVDNLVRFVQEK